MKKVTIFLAYHKDELASDTNRIVNFVYKLNEVYESRNVEFATVDCNEVDQAQLAQLLEQCEIAFVLVSQHVDRHIFDVTFDVFKKLGRPKITTFFKYQHDVNEATGEVKEFLDFLDGQLHHYYKVYNHIDSLKLHILMQVKRLGLDFVNPELQGDDICVDGQSIATTSNLGVFTQNASLADTQRQIAQVNGEIANVIAQLQGANGNQQDALVQQLAGLSQNKKQLADKLAETQKQVLQTLLNLYGATADDGASQRQIVASRYMDAGQWDKAKEVLNKDAILLELKTNCENADLLKNATEQANKKVQQNVEELLQRIAVLKQEGLTEATVAEVSELYQIAFQHAQERNLNLSNFVSYVEFLTAQNRAVESLSVGNSIEQSWQNGAPVSHEQRLNFYSMMQTNAIGLFNSELVEKYTDLLEKHFRDGGNSFNGGNYMLLLLALIRRYQYCTTSNNNKQLQLEILNKGIAYAKTLVAILPDTGAHFLQIFQTQLLFCTMDTPTDDAIRQLIATMETSAKNTTEETLQANPSLRVNYAMTRGILAIMYYSLGETEQSDFNKKCYEQNLAIVEGFAKVNPEAFAPQVVQLRSVQLIMASMEVEEEETSDDELMQLEQQLLSYIESVEAIFDDKPDMYAIPLAEAYQQYAEVCFSKGEEQLGVTYFFQSVDLLQSQMQNNAKQALPLQAKMAAKIISQIAQLLPDDLEQLSIEEAHRHLETAKKLLLDATAQIDSLSRGRDRLFQPTERAGAYTEIARAFNFEKDEIWENTLDEVEEAALPSVILDKRLVVSHVARFKKSFQLQEEPNWQPNFDNLYTYGQEALMPLAMYYYKQSMKILQSAQDLEGNCLLQTLEVCSDALALAYHYCEDFADNYAMLYLELFSTLQQQATVTTERLLETAKLATIVLSNCCNQ